MRTCWFAVLVGSLCIMASDLYQLKEVVPDLSSEKFKGPDLENHKSQFSEKADVVDSSSDHDNAHSVRKRTINQNETNLCSNISRSEENSKHRLLYFYGISWLCCSCGKGEKILWPCRSGKPNTTHCVPCEPGSFMNKDAHGERECFVPNLNCNSETEVYIPHTPTSAPECHCREDKSLYRDSNGSCVTHSACPPGEGVQTPGTPFNDTVCQPCKPFYESPNQSRTEFCKLKDSVRRLPQNSNFPPTFKTGNFKKHPQMDTIRQELKISLSSPKFKYSGAAFTSIIVLSIAIYAYHKCKKNKADYWY